MFPFTTVPFWVPIFDPPPFSALTPPPPTGFPNFRRRRPWRGPNQSSVRLSVFFWGGGGGGGPRVPLFEYKPPKHQVGINYLAICLTRVPFVDYPKVDLNPGVLLLGEGTTPRFKPLGWSKSRTRGPRVHGRNPLERHHRSETPGMIRLPNLNTNQCIGFNHGFQAVRNGFRPFTVWAVLNSPTQHGNPRRGSPKAKF